VQRGEFLELVAPKIVGFLTWLHLELLAHLPKLRACSLIAQSD